MLRSKAITRDFQPLATPSTSEELGDLRFRALLMADQ